MESGDKRRDACGADVSIDDSGGSLVCHPCTTAEPSEERCRP